MQMKRSVWIFILGALLVILGTLPYSEVDKKVTTEAQTVIRAAIDIGSGSTKLRVAEVDLERGKIVKTLVNEQFTILYMRDLTSAPEGAFSDAVQKEGIAAIEKAKKIAKEHGAERVIALATAAFRKASNGEQFVQQIIKETGVPVFIVDQDLEGELAFKAAMTRAFVPPHLLVVFDIGGGSMQLTSQDESGNFQIYRGHEAVEPFKNYVLEVVQGRDVTPDTSPNPMSVRDVQSAATHYNSVANEVNKIFKEKLQNPQVRTIGVGSVFAYGILPAVGGKNPFTVQDLTEAIYEMTGLTDEELGGADFVEVKLTNAILIRSVMQTLNIPEIRVLDVNNADGAFFYEAFWKDDAQKL